VTPDPSRHEIIEIRQEAEQIGKEKGIKIGEERGLKKGEKNKAIEMAQKLSVSGQNFSDARQNLSDARRNLSNKKVSYLNCG
jgi:flagellar biosynthesis/type III secretory pathway protein FliH